MQRFLAYFDDLRRDAGPRLWWAVALVAAGAVLEGFGILAILPFAALITGTADTQAAQSMLTVMTNAGLDTEWSRAAGLAGVFVTLLVLRGMAIWLRDTTLFQMGLGYVDRWRSRMFAAIANADWATVSTLRRTDIEHAVTNDVSRLSSGTDRLLRSGAAMAQTVVQLGIIALLSPVLLLLVFALMLVAFLVTLPLMRRADALGERITRAGRRIHGVLGDFMASQKLARLNNAENDFLVRFDDAITDVRSHQIAFYKSQASARVWFQIAAGFVVIAALLIGFFILETPVSVLAITLIVLARLVGPIQLLAQSGQAVANALPAFAALKSLHSDLLEAAQDTEPGKRHTEAVHGPAEIQLQAISYTHAGAPGPVLKHIDLRVKAGEIIALNGSSGAGKTTLLDILSGLLPPDSGRLIASGEDITAPAAMRAWRKTVAYLPQDPFLFDATIRENLIWSADNPTDADIAEAVRLSEADTFLEASREGLDTRAGERGQLFSGGERQRLCLARALLRKPRLLILDEATSALDAQIEERILQRLAGMRDRFSILYVTHRDDALRHADRVIRLEDGMIVESKADG